MRSYTDENIKVEPPKPAYPCLKIAPYYGTVYLVTSDTHAVVVLQGHESGASPLGYVTYSIKDLKPYTGPAIVLEP